ncbi:molybdenum cofactor guanylyltransferase [Desulfosporosinus nitroreducens]|uniref:Molybdenum cofactor guanylyltransferase n=2 Tax=Desulfosporosinus nitroreducens TaxID=2018668 RepID=A0ABT8QX23_9FIRM|nr:molybdenum cofactor guanylyltransferase [Desulfosporosinus nitroreducens]
MKKNKAFLELEGKPLVERSLTVLQAVFAEVLISSNKAELYEGFEVPIILDEIPGRGPLEGIYQGLKAAAYDEVFVLACDIPFLRTELIRFMATWNPVYDVVVPSLQSGLHPLHAFYHRRCLPLIKKSLEANSLKVIDLYPSCSVRYVKETELQNYNNLSRLFCNINTPEDWSAILTEGEST